MKDGDEVIIHTNYMTFVSGVFRLKRGVKSMSKCFNYELWLNDAEEKYLKLEIGKTFILKALFEGSKGRDWNDLGSYASRFGRKFSERVADGRFIGIEQIKDTSPRKYRRIDT